MLRYSVSALLLLVLTLGVKAQEISLNSSFWLNRSYYNPSNTALSLDGRSSELMLSARNQWVGLGSSPKAYGFRCDYSLSSKNAVGIQVWNQEFGTFTNSVLQVPYSFEAKFSERIKMVLGVSSSFYSISPDFSRLTNASSIDFGVMDYSYNHFDATFGASIYYANSWRIGFFTTNFLAGLNTENSLGILGNLGMKTGIDFSFQKSLNVVKVELDGLLFQNVNTGLSIGEFWGRAGAKGFSLGIGVGTNESLHGSLGLRLNSKLRLDYIYTYTNSALRNFTNGSHQLGLSYVF